MKRTAARTSVENAIAGAHERCALVLLVLEEQRDALRVAASRLRDLADAAGCDCAYD